MVSPAGPTPRPRRQAAGRDVMASLLVFLTLAPAVRTQPIGTGRPDEYGVKAAILYNLAKFVDWPTDAFADPAASLVICVLGVDPFGGVLDETVRGHGVGRRAVVAKRIVDVTTGCHVLFIASSERRRLPAIMDRLHTRSVLTISEADGFTEQGGMIGLATEGERVRFDINVDAAERARLKVSARLMALASAVRRSRSPGR